jgi:transposase
MIPVDFQVGHGNSSEREALLKMASAGVTYIADRGYMSFQLCKDLIDRQAFFVFRVKENLIYTVTETLDFSMPDSTISFFDSISDELIRYENDKSKTSYRLVRFAVNQENYFILTNRRDLTTFQIIMLYAYRWQIELFFRFLKRSMGGIHLVRHDKEGIAIQFYTMMTLALLQLHLKQDIMDKLEVGENESGEEKLSKSDTGKGERNIEDNKKSPVSRKVSSNSRLGDTGFLASLGGAVKKYWKIGVHWLAALRDLLARPFDARTLYILQNSI